VAQLVGLLDPRHRVPFPPWAYHVVPSASFRIVLSRTRSTTSGRSLAFAFCGLLRSLSSPTSSPAYRSFQREDVVCVIASLRISGASSAPLSLPERRQNRLQGESTLRHEIAPARSPERSIPQLFTISLCVGCPGHKEGGRLALIMRSGLPSVTQRRAEGKCGTRTRHEAILCSARSEVRQ
jgi:hypothetical protein